MPDSQTTDIPTHYTIPADHAYGFKTKGACSRRVEEVYFTRLEQRHRTLDMVRGRKLFHHSDLGKGVSRDTIHSIYARCRQMSCGREQQSRHLQGVCMPVVFKLPNNTIETNSRPNRVRKRVSVQCVNAKTCQPNRVPNAPYIQHYSRKVSSQPPCSVR